MYRIESKDPHGVHGSMTITTEVQGVPDQKHNYSTQTFRPETLQITYRMDGRGIWAPTEWRLSGRRVLKDGGLGLSVHENHGYGFRVGQTVPAWIDEAAAYFAPERTRVLEPGSVLQINPRP